MYRADRLMPQRKIQQFVEQKTIVSLTRDMFIDLQLHLVLIQYSIATDS